MGHSVKSKMNQKYLKILTLSAMLISNVGLNVPAYSNTITEKMNVSADINASCIMSNTSLNFGEYNAIGINASQDLTATAKISTTCTPGAIGSVKMNYGKHPSIKVSRGRGPTSGGYNRNMSSEVSASKLMYEIYTNEDRTSIWTPLMYKTVVGSGASADLPVYAKVFKNQLDVTAGSYTDTINITLTF